jgi:dihydrofolate synthase/folylpolyglutamate synthase
MDYKEALDFIYSRQRFGIKLGLQNITELMQKLDNPQDSFKSIHVAGTNGKGSTSAFIASILQEAGYKVGIYTSPHLVDFRERIQINNKLISKPDLIATLQGIKPLVKDETYFELSTAIAFKYFAEKEVDFAVVEVGMGGRLDATNILKPELSIITSISFDHVKHLGDKLDKIAYEKAGIIKEGKPVLVPENIESFGAIEKIARERNSKFVITKAFEGKLPLTGAFQHQNAGLAVEAVKYLNPKTSGETIQKGLMSTKWPGRMQYVKPGILFDCAHNPEGAKLLAKELKKTSKDILLIISMTRGKDIKGFCSHLEPLAKEVVVTRAAIDRAEKPEKLAEALTKPCTVFQSVSNALDYALKTKKDIDLIVLAGSIFAVGDGFEALGISPFE